MTARCQRCGGSVVALGHESRRCIQCGWDGTQPRKPTKQDKIASRHIKSIPPPMRKLDWRILAGDADVTDKAL